MSSGTIGWLPRTWSIWNGSVPAGVGSNINVAGCRPVPAAMHSGWPCEARTQHPMRMIAGTMSPFGTGTSTRSDLAKTLVTWGTGRPTAITSPTCGMVIPAVRLAAWSALTCGR